MRAVGRVVGLWVVMLGLGAARAQDGGAAPSRPPAEVAAKAPARPALGAVYDALNRVVRFKQVAISPDGARVAWVESVPEKDGPAPDKSLIQVVERARPDAPPVRITASKDGAPRDEGSLAWSPDGKQVAFLSDAEQHDQAQLYVADASGGGAARKLTSLKGRVAAPRWAPDGKSVALLTIEGVTDAKGPLGPAARETGVVQESHPVKRVTVVSVADGRARTVSPESLFVHDYAWSPDSARFAIIASPPPGDANWWVARIYAVEAGSGATSLLYVPKWQLAEPTWSPDGKQLAFIEGLMSDEGVTGGDVRVVSVAERLAAKVVPGPKAALPAGLKPARNLTPGLKASASNLYWVAPDRLVFGAQVQGEAALASVDPGSGAVTVLWKGPEHVSEGRAAGASFARDGVTSAVLRDSFSTPADVWSGPVGQWTRLTRRNADVEVPVGKVRSVTWKSDGLDVQGWLVAPPSVPAGTRAPMVTVVHGGPASSSTAGFFGQVVLLASQGYYVFLPNPRGSFGQGEDFVQANRRDFGYGDLRDILTGVDTVLASEPVDHMRLGVTGWSYGGFMAMWAVTQTQRFRAAVAGAGIANWQSYYGTNHIDAWMLPYFGASVYDDPDVYTRSSPINYVKQVRTPTLVLQGERDVEVPASQGYEFYKALKTLGVKTQLVIYADEGHGFRKPEHQKDRALRTVEWLDANLRTPAAAAPLKAPAPSR